MQCKLRFVCLKQPKRIHCSSIHTVSKTSTVSKQTMYILLEGVKMLRHQYVNGWMLTKSIMNPSYMIIWKTVSQWSLKSQKKGSLSFQLNKHLYMSIRGGTDFYLVCRENVKPILLWQLNLNKYWLIVRKELKYKFRFFF